MNNPQYPIYIPSKGRFENCLTAKCFVKDGVDFKLVIEEQEYTEYASRFDENRLLVLPFSNQGSVIPARNWIKEHATAAGYERHWQFDDNIRIFFRRWKGRRIPVEAGTAITVIEDFTNRYENIAISGFNYRMFAPDSNKLPPFYLNCHVYSACLILNSLPFEWRGKYNEDTDYCLQVLSHGWCTVLVNAFLVDKIATMKMKGGNKTELYDKTDGRLKMARSLERLWPGVVETKRRFGRPQHVVKDAWKRFDTPLKLKAGINLEDLPPVDDYGLKLKQVKEIQSEDLRRFVEDEIEDK